ncbi:protein of unknown function DUF214 [Sulfobacillus acidophilus TPY]|uniref:ABC transporter permease n=1 Tax=Sulfobacillus acidophilus (strain ATCC 700253 / DSM 10332 / NAL) TaxID=679936 RepID=G8U1B4_SULAD|nr:protein of unknown function DUF214 [Sulfobacillus acidophilus TPY]AEW05434.1 protein of unknown function DUF214 [Sulfobacillus acidophilus DSM 10332]
MIRQAIEVALRSLWTQKLRSLLTMLGVIIGVGAVLALVALGKGAQAAITSNIQGLGSNLIVASIGSNPFQTANQTQPTPVPPVSMNQALTLAHLPGIQAVAPVMTGSGTAAVGDTSTSVNVIGTTPSYSQILNYQVDLGRNLSPLDIQADNPVVVLGNQAATTLFGQRDPVGDMMTINGVPFTVIGVYQPKGTSFGQSQDNFAEIPWTTAERLFGPATVTTIELSAAPKANVTAVENHLNQQLLDWLGSSGNFSVTAQSQILSTLNAVSQVTTVLLGGVAGISLVVGGIGIMNIMLVSVSERTREIGIRKAIGASPMDILVQFLIEAVLLSLIGGLIGLAAGVLFSRIMTQSFHLPSAIQPSIALVALGFALLVGIVFGIWPASRAARMRPAEALRWE